MTSGSRRWWGGVGLYGVSSGRGWASGWSGLPPLPASRCNDRRKGPEPPGRIDASRKGCAQQVNNAHR
jgi:hypothetical protein